MIDADCTTSPGNLWNGCAGTSVHEHGQTSRSAKLGAPVAGFSLDKPPTGL